MSTIIGNAVTIGGGGAKLNIDYGSTPPTDTTKLWVPLEKKPDAVECKPASLSGSEFFESSSAISSILSHASDCGAYFQHEEYIYYLYSTSRFTRINVNTHAVDNSVPLSNVFTNLTMLDYNCGFCQHGDKVYIVTTTVEISGTTYNGTIIVEGNLSTKLAAKLGDLVKDPDTSIYCTGAAITYCNGKLYIAGGKRKSYANSTNTVKVYNLSDNTSHIAYNMSYKLSNATMAVVSSNVYIFGGAHNIDVYQDVYKIDTINNTISTVATYPIKCLCMSPFVCDSSVYLFGGSKGASNNEPISAGSLTSIYKFDTKTNTFSLLPISLPTARYSSPVYNSNLYCYVCGIAPVTSNTGRIDKFVVNVPLTKNYLLIQQDYGFDGLWSSLKSKDTDFKVKVINAYLGDSNNIAQPTNAYLYDSKDLKWKSLSGESYVADMQNALNILGVN